jgi:hypothetical protein
MVCYLLQSLKELSLPDLIPLSKYLYKIKSVVYFQKNGYKNFLTPMHMNYPGLNVMSFGKITNRRIKIVSIIFSKPSVGVILSSKTICLGSRENPHLTISSGISREPCPQD